MDSPERNQIVTSTSPASPVQDSPFSDFLKNLSPIHPVKAVRSSQGFPELSFPPPVFTSPRINALRETGLKRSICLPRSSTSELSHETESRDKIIICGSLVSESSTVQSVVGLISSPHKGHNSEGPVQVKSCSPSGSVEEYLTDPVEVDDCANSTNLANLSTFEVHDQTEAATRVYTSSNETTIRLDNHGPANVLDTEVVAALDLQQVEEDPLTKSLIQIKSVNSEYEQKSYEIPSTKCIDIISEKVNDLFEPDTSLEPVSSAQRSHHFETDIATKDLSFLSKRKEHDNMYSGEEKHARSRILIRYGSRAVKLPSVENRIQVKQDSTPHLLPEYLPSSQTYENHGESSGANSKGSLEDCILYDSEEGSQYQRGTLRRCLQFEATDGNTNLNSPNSWKSQTDVLLSSSSPQNPKDFEIMHSSHLKSRLTSSNKQAVNFSQPVVSRSSTCQLEMPEIDKSLRNSVSSSIIGSMPSGIGLHLNSIVGAAAAGCDATASIKFVEKGYSMVHSETPSAFDCSLPGDSKSSPISTSLVDNFSNFDNNQQESLTIVTTRSATFQSPRDLQCITKSLQLEVIEHSTTPCDKMKSSSENADRFEEFNQPFSQKKRKRTLSGIENDGCKRCNCKKSKCLKLYCECFAAGVYCSGPCSCLECYNKPEHEDTVLGTRQQIETRNPLAFAPKIVKRVDESPVNSVEEGNRMTPASARHKRGCNCKKSMCLKKYCECYQSGVGCSDGCRCEGCKNSFGIKEGYGESRDLHTKADSERWEESSDDKLDMAKIKFDKLYPEQHPQKLSPLTPLFQSSNHGKDTNKSKSIARRYLPSPESDWPETGDRTLDIACYDPESECNSAGRMAQISQRQDEHVDVYDQTPGPHDPSRVVVSSSSSKSRGVIKVSRAHGLQGNACLSSVAPLRWLDSPITPLPQFLKSKIPHDPDSDSRLYETLEDDTPDILKDTHTPIKAFKASSPNQKRVSPPHSHVHELRSTSSPSMKSGRKFVLRSISAFPPLTPHSDPKVARSDK